MLLLNPWVVREGATLDLCSMGAAGEAYWPVMT